MKSSQLLTSIITTLFYVKEPAFQILNRKATYLELFQMQQLCFSLQYTEILESVEIKPDVFSQAL